MITKHAANIFSSIWNGAQKAGSGVGTALGSAAAVGFPVYQYMSGEDSIGGAAGSVAGGAACTVAGKAIGQQLGRVGPMRQMRGAAVNIRRASRGVGNSLQAAGDSLLHAKGGNPMAIAGKRLGGYALKGLGKAVSMAGNGAGAAIAAPAKSMKTVGMLGGGIFGFEAGRNIGNKYVPIHQRDPMPQVKQAAAASVVKPILSPLWKKRMKITGGAAGIGLAAYYGNKNFNEKRDAMAEIPQYQPVYPQKFYPAQAMTQAVTQ